MTDPVARSLRELTLSTAMIPILDELAGLEMCLPAMPDAMERHAALLERLPPVLDLRGRALVHGQHYERFLALAEADPSALEDRVDTANALAILAHAGEIAMLLVPAASDEDRFARAMLSKERLEQYGAGHGVHETEVMHRALRQGVRRGGYRLVIGSRIPADMEEPARRFNGVILPQPGSGDGSGPGVYPLEEALSLEAWFTAPPDLTALLDQAQALLATIEAWSDADEPGPRWIGARHGALILAYARLCRVGLWPARSAADLIAKQELEDLLAERIHDPDSMRALVEIALGVGRRIARQGPPFVTRLGGVEL